MPTRYYTHFVAEASEALQRGEYSGVVETLAPLRPQRELKELKNLLASNLAVEAEDIRILNWARLH